MMLLRKGLLRFFLWFCLIWVFLEGSACIALWNTSIEQQDLPNDSLMPFDPYTLWAFAPNSSLETDGLRYYIDAHSMRKSSSNAGKEAMLFVGDSSTFGLKVSAAQTLPEQSAVCCGLRPLNAGVSGYSTLQIAAQLPNLLKQFKPKWVVLVVPWSDLMHTTVTDEERILRAQKVVMIRRVMAFPVIRRSFIVRWLIHSAQQRMQSNPVTLDPQSILQSEEKAKSRRVSATMHIENIKSSMKKRS